MATEQLYRMGAGGILEAVQPEGRGRAEAMRTFLARGGGLSKSGRYRSGPMKGKTVQEATTMFEDHWAGASGAVKDKYAARARDILSPSEKREAGIGTPAPPKPAGKMYADQKANRMGFYSKINGVQPTPAQKTFAPSSKRADEAETASQRASHGSEESGEYGKNGDLSKQAMGTPEQQAQVAAMMGEGEKYGTATVGNYLDMQSAVAAERGDLAGVSREIEQKKAAEAAAAEKAKFDSDIAAAEQRRNAARQAAGIVTPPPAAAATPPAAAPSPSVAGMPTDERMHAQGKTNSGTNPVVKAPPTPPQISGVNPAPKINSLTGLPMGYRPGDAVAPQFKPAADASVSRQIAADPRLQPGGGAMVSGPPSQPVTGSVMKPQIAGITPAPRPVSMSRPDGYQATSQRQDWDRENAAASARASAKITNPDDPRKFFTGRVLPLDQLNNPSKAPSSGYQAGGIGPSGGRVLSVRPARR